MSTLREAYRKRMEELEQSRVFNSGSVLRVSNDYSPEKHQFRGLVIQHFERNGEPVVSSFIATVFERMDSIGHLQESISELMRRIERLEMENIVLRELIFDRENTAIVALRKEQKAPNFLAQSDAALKMGPVGDTIEIVETIKEGR